MADLSTARRGAEAARGTIFISYAREDVAFVRRLLTGLSGRGHEVSYELNAIFPSEEFWPKICALIDDAEAHQAGIEHAIVA